MRNLKKILALVLALIMSLSLMATAGATDFKDDESIDTYQTAIEVLSGLKVFGGDQNGNFNPKDPIRRSEVAAIIYRIATGDVTNEHNASYGLYNQFKDVQDGDWFAGYVSYCHNAGYIKGHGDGTFAPYDNVTGYQALAMILRAVGYDKNNEFTGDNWQINTASIATQRGVLKGLQSTEDLKAPATRELVAEILFQSILIDKVQWNALTHSYDTTTEKVADVLSLEKITGVVIANEYAALDDTKPLAAGKTKLDVNGTDYVLDWAEDGYEASLDVIGQSRIAYVQKVANKPYTVLNLADTGTNTVNANVKDDKGGLKMKLSEVAAGLTTNDDTQHYINFNPSTSPICDMRIEYELNFKNQAALDEFTRITGVTQQKLIDTMGPSKSTDVYAFAYGPVVIAANNKDKALNDDHLSIIEGIFTVADAKGSADLNNNAKNIDGAVYVGTRSEGDLSDTMGYKKFDETYIERPVTKISNVARGNDLRVIDNNGDGVAEYALRIDYTLDRIVDAVTKNDSTTYYYNKLTAPVVLLNPDYERAVGDVVLYAVIDGKAYMHLAETATANFKSVSYKAETATDTDGKVWEQSEINNQSKLPGEIAAVSENAEYKLYLDNHGYIRAYDSKSNYALLTEVYHTNRQNQAWVTGTSLTAEATLAGGVATREYQVLNNYYLNTSGNYNPFYTDPTSGTHAVTQPLNPTEPNFLHAATAGLDITGCTGTNAHKPFDWDATDAGVEKSWTNVAEYTLGENGINLFSASTTDGSREYIQLDDTRGVGTNQNRALYQIYNQTNQYVRAVDDTVFFVVAKNGGNGQAIVREYVGWNNVPTLNNGTNGIHAMYAVARNTRNQEINNVTGAYWVADVIVIEVEQLTNVFESVALVYSNDNKTTGRVKYLQALDNVKGEITIVPKNLNVWQGQYQGYGFYGLMDVEAVEGEANTYSANIRYISNTTKPTLGYYCDWSDVLTGGAHPANFCNDFNENGIYYGKVRSVNGELDRSRYITVDVLDWFGNIVDTDDIHLTANSGAYAINHKTSGTTEWNEAVSLVLNQSASNRVEIGDEILWVKVPGTTDSTVGFIVDLTDTGITGINKPTKRSWDTPTWLETLANDPTYYGTLSKNNGSIAWAQYNNGPQTIGSNTAAFNFEAVIDVTPARARVAQPYPSKFVVSNYELYVKGSILTPVFSGILSDGLWHVRYQVPTSTTAETVATVQVVNNTGNNLFVNTTLETAADTWTVTIPATPAADVGKTVYVNTVADTGDPLTYNKDDIKDDVTIEDDPEIKGDPVTPADPVEAAKAEITKAAEAVTKKLDEALAAEKLTQEQYEALVAELKAATDKAADITEENASDKKTEILAEIAAVEKKIPVEVGENEWKVTINAKNVTAPAISKVEKDAELKVQLTKSGDYELPETVTVKMGGKDLTVGTDYTYENGLITIAKVTGEVEITAEGVSTDSGDAVWTEGLAKPTINQAGDTITYPYLGETKPTADDVKTAINGGALEGFTAKLASVVLAPGGASAIASDEAGKSYTVNFEQYFTVIIKQSKADADDAETNKSAYVKHDTTGNISGVAEGVYIDSTDVKGGTSPASQVTVDDTGAFTTHAVVTEDITYVRAVKIVLDASLSGLTSSGDVKTVRHQYTNETEGAAIVSNQYIQVGTEIYVEVKDDSITAGPKQGVTIGKNDLVATAVVTDANKATALKNEKYAVTLADLDDAESDAETVTIEYVCGYTLKVGEETSNRLVTATELSGGLSSADLGFTAALAGGDGKTANFIAVEAKADGVAADLVTVTGTSTGSTVTVGGGELTAALANEGVISVVPATAITGTAAGLSNAKYTYKVDEDTTVTGNFALSSTAQYVAKGAELTVFAADANVGDQIMMETGDAGEYAPVGTKGSDMGKANHTVTVGADALDFKLDQQVNGIAIATGGGILTKDGSTPPTTLNAVPTGLTATGSTVTYAETDDAGATVATVTTGTKYTITIKVKADTGYHFGAAAIDKSQVSITPEADGATIAVTEVSAPDTDGFVTITATFTAVA